MTLLWVASWGPIGGHVIPQMFLGRLLFGGTYSFAITTFSVSDSMLSPAVTYR